jgi:hypothetical protein
LFGLVIVAVRKRKKPTNIPLGSFAGVITEPLVAAFLGA